MNKRNGMTLRQLEAFFWAAHFGSFSSAATKLHMTQSALSKRIAELEGALGNKLFDRDLYRPKLTAHGRLLLDKARQMLALQGEIQDCMRNTDVLEGECRFGVTELVAMTWLPDLVTLIRKAYPNVILEPYVDLSHRLHEKLLEGTVDFAVMPLNPLQPGLSSELLAQVDFSLMASPSLVERDAMATSALLAELPVLTQISGSGLTPIFDAWAHANGLKLHRILGSNSLTAIAHMVVAQLGIGFLPTAYFSPLVESGHLGCLHTAAELPRLDYFLTYRTVETSALARAMRDAVIKVCDFSRRQPAVVFS
jgi:DNA-binding transcriptional LysR family regulator